MTARPGDSTISTVVGKLLGRSAEEGDERLYLGAFGKHPGWGDFWSAGLETHRLVDVRDRLLVQGIGGNLQSGAWGDPQDPYLQDGFREVLLWHLPGDVVVGRMWPSRDAKGRRYPMLVCAQCRRLPLGWILEEVLPRLEEVQRRCSQADSAAEVTSILDVTRRELRLLAEDVPESASVAQTEGSAVAPLAEHLHDDQQRLHRVFYEIQREMSGYTPERFRPGAAAEGKPAARMRVPRCADSPGEALRLWTDFLLTQLHSETPLLLLQPLGKDWVDVIAGAPTAAELYCLAVGPEELPLATEIPFTLEPHFVENVDRVVDESGGRRPSAAPAGAAPAEEPPREETVRPPESRRASKLLWIVIPVVLVLLAAVAAVLLFGAGGNPPEAHTKGLPPPAPPAPGAPGFRYAAAYQEWFRELYESVREHHDRWAADGWLNRNVVQPLADARATGTEFDPARSPDGQPEERAVSTAGEIKSAFEEGNWPLPDQVRGFSKQCRELNWPHTADRLRVSADKIKLAPGLAAGVEEVLGHRKLLERWRATEGMARKVDGRAHAFLPP